MRRHAKASSATSNAREGTRARFAVAAALALIALVAFVAPASSEPLVTENYASFGPDGTESTDFQRIRGVAVDQQTDVVYVLDGDGTLQKFEADGTPLDFTGLNPAIVEGKITGLDVYPQGAPTQVTVDSASHRIYVTEKTAIRAFQSDGEPAEFTEGPGATTNAIPGFLETGGVAVDANGAIYASDCAEGNAFVSECDSGSVSIYAPTGAPLKTLAVEKPRNLAVASDGVVYVIERAVTVRKLIPSEFPVTAATTYTDGGSISVSNVTLRSVVIDPLNGDVFILQVGGMPNKGSISQFDKEGNLLRTLAKSGEIGELGSDPRGIAVVVGGVEFQLYVGDSQETGDEIVSSKVAIFGEEIIEGPPAIRATSAIDVTADSATLRAQVNPNTAATTYRFEYGPEPCTSGSCTVVPLPDGQIPAGHRFVSVSEQLLGLDANTTYHYRVTAENSFDPPTEGPERTFDTQAFGLGFELTDSRAWEMVSPTDKHGARIVGAPAAGYTSQAAADGSGLAYLTLGSIEADPRGSRAPEPTTVLARRSASGWQGADIGLPHSELTILAQQGEYQLFSPDLARAIVLPPDGTLLSPQASERTPNLRENTDTPLFTPLLSGKEGFANVPAGTKFGSGGGTGVRSAALVQAATEDLSHIGLTSNVPLIAGAPNEALYEWHAGELLPVSKLPASEGGGWLVGDATLGSGYASVRNAISADGSRVFWSSGFYSDTALGNQLTALYLRDTETEETVRLDVDSGTSGLGEGRPVFQGASADGTAVFFTYEQQLSAGSSPAGGLYRCEIPAGNSAGGCATLTDLTPSPGPGESAEVLGLASGLGEDGKTISFVARGALDATPNSHGDSAVAGEPNLYRWEEGEGARFIATLSEEDKRDWGLRPTAGGDGGSSSSGSYLSATSSPSGRYFTFMSERGLTGDDNLDSVTEEPVQQVFLYDTATDQLRCVSCSFSGSSPRGRALAVGTGSRVDPLGLWEGKSRLAAILPDTTASGGDPFFFPLYRPRTVLDNGRVFFNSADSLVAGDSNGQWDVYQYEPTGVGSCTEESEGGAVVSSESACVSLLSSGTAAEEAAFLDSSESGDDVFFTTPAKLSVLDEDTIDDVYDARVNGVIAQRPVLNECLGEACQPAPTPPNDPTPASAAFRGAGNVASERCPDSKRRVMRDGHPRCVAKKHKKKRSHKAKRAASNQRAGR